MNNPAVAAGLSVWALSATRTKGCSGRSRILEMRRVALSAHPSHVNQVGIGSGWALT